MMLQPFWEIENSVLIRLQNCWKVALKVPGKANLKKIILDFYDGQECIVKEILGHCLGAILMTADVWSSSVYRGYMVISGHWIENS